MSIDINRYLFNAPTLAILFYSWKIKTNVLFLNSECFPTLLLLFAKFKFCIERIGLIFHSLFLMLSRYAKKSFVLIPKSELVSIFVSLIKFYLSRYIFTTYQ